MLTFDRRFYTLMTSLIRELFFYPIKSLAGISCSELVIGSRGAEGDRRWMLVDENGRFITQREYPGLCMFDVSRSESGYRIRSREISHSSREIVLPQILQNGPSVQVSVWSDTSIALEASEEVNRYFSAVLDRSCRLVYMPEYAERFSDTTYAGAGVLNSFSDGYPMLLLGSASLEELNRKLAAAQEPALGWDRFRPNIVAETSVAHCEDSWAEFKLGEIHARGVKLCSRCVFTTINQADASKGKEPLKTLASYRNLAGKIMFGQNVVPSHGRIRIGDTIEVTKTGYPANAVF